MKKLTLKSVFHDSVNDNATIEIHIYHELNDRRERSIIIFDNVMWDVGDTIAYKMLKPYNNCEGEYIKSTNGGDLAFKIVV